MGKSITERINQAIGAFFSGTDSDQVFIPTLYTPSPTEVGVGTTETGNADVIVTSSILADATHLRCMELAKPRLRVYDQEGAPLDNMTGRSPAVSGIATLLDSIDQNALLYALHWDHYIYGRAYLWVQRGSDFNLMESSFARPTGFIRLEPRKVQKSVYPAMPPNQDAQVIYRYQGQEIDSNNLIPFERYDSTNALTRLKDYLELERNTLKNKARDSKYKKPKWAYSWGEAKGASAKEIAMEVARIEKKMMSNTPFDVFPIRPDAKLDVSEIPMDEELKQVLDVVTQAISRDSGVPAHLLGNDNATSRWNTVRDTRRAFWENHVIGDLNRLEALITSKLIPNSNMKIAFDLSEIEVLGESREVNAATSAALVGAAVNLQTLGWSDTEVKEWLEERMPKP